MATNSQTASSQPDQNSSRAAIAIDFETINNDRRLTISYRRRLGSAGGLTYRLEWSATGDEWVNVDPAFEIAEIKALYDGRGTEMVKYVATDEGETSGLFRIKIGHE